MNTEFQPSRAPLSGVPVKWGKVIDNARCIACHACTVACKQEHRVPLGVTRTYVKQVEVGAFPQVRRHFQVTRCNQCDDPPCVEACPVTAMFQRPDGIVDFDRERCIGCKACMAACPYDAIYINPNNRSAEKCNFCAHRIDQGLTPACVAVCPTQAIIIGDLNDPESAVARITARDKVDVRKPEKDTRPKLFYRQASEYTLLPMAAVSAPIQAAVNWGGGPAQPPRRAEPRTTNPPPFATQARTTNSPPPNPGAGVGNRGRAGTMVETAAAALLAYDTPHRAPWDWKVTAYTWTKSIAAGIFLVFAFFWWREGPLPGPWPLLASGLSGLFLAMTGALLIAHLSHPARFWYILARPQWRSWLARGAYIMAGYGLLLGGFFPAALAGAELLMDALVGPGAILALLSAVFTAFLMGQSRGRDLWQNPLLPAHFAVHSAAAGLAATLLFAPLAGLEPVTWSLGWALAGAGGVNLLLSLSELAMPLPTADGKRAVESLTLGRHAGGYWAGIGLSGLAPLVAMALGAGGVPAGVAVLVGLLLYQHAYLQAGQSVPLS